MRGEKKCQSLFPDRSWSRSVKMAERIVGHGRRPANAASATYTGVAPIVIHDDISSEWAGEMFLIAPTLMTAAP